MLTMFYPQDFDPSLLKKKKKKKTFDLDAVIAGEDGPKNSNENTEEGNSADLGLNDFEDNLDLESFGKKKKKKKKPFNLDDLEGALPTKENNAIDIGGEALQEEEADDDDFDLDMDFSKTKKKKKKKKELDEILADKIEEDKLEDKENGKIKFKIYLFFK